jgi:SP family sugar:H+ symporter-like MFS transporter
MFSLSFLSRASIDNLQAFFASTWGPIAWVVIGEIFPLNIRGKGVALSAASNWLLNWAIGYATPFLVRTGPGNAGLESKVFFIWGSTCLGCFIFAYFFIPETKGLTLEQVDILYQHTTPIKSNAYRKQILAKNIHSVEDSALVEVDQTVGGGILGRRKTRDAEKGESSDHNSQEEKA